VNAHRVEAEVGPERDIRVVGQLGEGEEFLGELNLGRVDLVGNDRARTAAHGGGVAVFFKDRHRPDNFHVRQFAAHVVGEAGHVPLRHPQRRDAAFDQVNVVVRRVVVTAGGGAGNAVFVDEVLNELERFDVLRAVEDDFTIGIVGPAALHEHDGIGRENVGGFDGGHVDVG